MVLTIFSSISHAWRTSMAPLPLFDWLLKFFVETQTPKASVPDRLKSQLGQACAPQGPVSGAQNFGWPAPADIASDGHAAGGWGRRLAA